MEPLVVLVDVDHTLLDGEGVRAQLARAVEAVAGHVALPRFWALYEDVRAELGAVDVPEAAARLESEFALPAGLVIEEIERADFRACLHEGALEALDHIGRLGTTVVLSDGDLRFQRAKIESAGIAAAVGGRVVITKHKERELSVVEQRFPGAHYALLDDRAGILAAVKAQWGARVTTVHVRQGRYAAEADSVESTRPDLVLDSIRDALRLELATLRPEPR